MARNSTWREKGVVLADRGGEEGGVGHTGSAKEGVVAPGASKRMAAFSSSST